MRFLFLFFVFSMILTGKTPAQQGIADKETGIMIRFVADHGMFPAHWYSKKINAQAVNLDPTQVDKAMRIMRHAFSKYPVVLLKENLARVYVLKSMTFYTFHFDGTNYKNMVFLSLDETNPNYTGRYIENAFHHEFSSILLKEYGRAFQLRMKWKDVVPRGFIYGKGGAEAIKNGAFSLNYDDDLINKGFLNEYSMASLEEDFNCISQNLFCGTETFWNKVNNNPALAAKVGLVIRFYHSIVPVFTEEYFRKMSVE